MPPVALLILPRLGGLKKASELLLTGKTIDAKEAELIGLINKVVPLASFDSDLEGLERIEKTYLEELMASENAQEGLKAFMEKRRPLWKNR